MGIKFEGVTIRRKSRYSKKPIRISDLNLDVDGRSTALIDKHGKEGPYAVLRTAAGLEDITEGRVTWSGPAGEHTGQPFTLVESRYGRDLTVDARDALMSSGGFKQVVPYMVSRVSRGHKLIGWGGLNQSVPFMVSRASRDCAGGVEGLVRKYSDAIGLKVSGKRVKDLDYAERDMMELVCAAALRRPVNLIGNLWGCYTERGLASMKILKEIIRGTWIYAASNLSAAKGMADRVVYMRDGSIEWDLPFGELYANPPNLGAAIGLGFFMCSGTIYKPKPYAMDYIDTPHISSRILRGGHISYYEVTTVYLSGLSHQSEQIERIIDKPVTVAISPEDMATGRALWKRLDREARRNIPFVSVNRMQDYDVSLFPDTSRLHFFDETGARIDMGYFGPKLDLPEQGRRCA